MMTTPWHELSNEMKWKVTMAQARELGFDVCASNPPFGKMNKYAMEEIREIEARNKCFLQEWEKRMARLKAPTHPILDQIEKDVELRLDEVTGQYELVFLKISFAINTI